MLLVNLFNNIKYMTVIIMLLLPRIFYHFLQVFSIYYPGHNFDFYTIR